MLITLFAFALVLVGCNQAPAPVLFPVVGAKYQKCLEAELRKAGAEYEFQPAPTRWGPTTAAVLWHPTSQKEEQRVWCEAAFCYSDTRDVRKGAFPDMCTAYQ